MLLGLQVSPEEFYAGLKHLPALKKVPEKAFMVLLPSEEAATCTDRILTDFVLEYATVRGRAWYSLLDAPVLTWDVTV